MRQRVTPTAPLSPAMVGCRGQHKASPSSPLSPSWRPVAAAIAAQNRWRQTPCDVTTAVAISCPENDSAAVPSADYLSASGDSELSGAAHVRAPINLLMSHLAPGSSELRDIKQRRQTPPLYSPDYADHRHGGEHHVFIRLRLASPSNDEQ